MITLKLSNVTLSGVTFDKLTIAKGQLFQLSVEGDGLSWFTNNDPVLDVTLVEGGIKALAAGLGVSRVLVLNDNDQKAYEFWVEVVPESDEAVVLEGAFSAKKK